MGRQPLYEGVGWVWEKASGLVLLGLGLVWLEQHVGVFGPGGVGIVAVRRIAVVISQPRGIFLISRMKWLSSSGNITNLGNIAALYPCGKP